MFVNFYLFVLLFTHIFGYEVFPKYAYRSVCGCEANKQKAETRLILRDLRLKLFYP